ncbi:hypothetical protein SLA2020_271750 [Shorea laevis]
MVLWKQREEEDEEEEEVGGEDSVSAMYYDYLAKTVFPPFAFHQTGNGTGCDCVSGCVDDCFCAMKNGGEFAYDHNGILVRGKPLVF